MSIWRVRSAYRTIDATLSLAGSVSSSRAALLIAALADGKSILRDMPAHASIGELIEGLRSLGVQIRTDEQARRVDVTGTRGFWPNSEAELELTDPASAGLLLAGTCAGRGQYRVILPGATSGGSFDSLLRGLVDLGASIAREDAAVQVRGAPLRGGRLTIPAEAAETALLVAPYAQNDVYLELTGPSARTSRLDETFALMDRFGVEVVTDDGQRLILPAPQRYTAAEFEIPPDHFTFACLLTATALRGGRLALANHGTRSGVMDTGLVELLKRIGLRSESTDHGAVFQAPPRHEPPRLGEAPAPAAFDAMALAAVIALFAAGETTLTWNAPPAGQDVLAGLVRLLEAFGAEAALDDHSLRVVPPAEVRPARIDAGDEPGAAAAVAAVVGVLIEGVEVENAEHIEQHWPGLCDYMGTLVA